MSFVQISWVKSKAAIILASFILIFAIKLGTIYYINDLTFSNHPEFKVGKIASASGDMFSYIGAMDNYIETGDYFFTNPLGEKIIAGRMPHYSIPYYFLRQIFSKPTSLDVYIFVQLALESSAILLFCLAINIIIGFRAAWITLSLFLVSLFLTVWNGIVLTDGPATSLLMIGIVLFILYLHTKIDKYYFLAIGILLLSITLRPYFIVIVGLLFLFEISEQFKKSKLEYSKFLYPAILLCLLLGPWTVRNYLILSKIIPFQQDLVAGYGHSETNIKLNNLLADLGEEGAVYWDNKNAGSYFHPEMSKSSIWQYPSIILNDQELFRPFERIREGRIKYGTGDNPKIDAELQWIKKRFLKEHPVYFILGPIKRVKNFLFHSGSYYLPINKNFKTYTPIQFILKVSQSLLYYAILLIGTLGLVVLALKKREYFILLIPFLFLIVFFPVYLKYTEWRFFIPFYPFSLLGLSSLLSKFLDHYVRRSN